MSYILDALRKAERERSVQQVPTLMTEHAPRNLNRKRFWIGTCIVLICAAAIAVYILDSRQTDSRLPLNSGHSGLAAITSVAPGETSVTEDEATKKNSPLALQEAREPAPPVQRTGGTGAVPQMLPAVVPPNAVRQQPLPNRRVAGIQNEEEYPDEPELEDIPPQEMPGNLPRRGRESSAPSEAAKPKPASLKDAVGKMNLSLLMTSDSKEERMVYIDGKRYGEGDYIDGVYLLEKITADGATISYQDERALLPVRSK